ncbi:SDR family oxidoreductase [Actinokineospora sp. NBRC 105648]|uniref:SDR family oxidoreductase n=1 Tax=Actinokineospora sp. NBRC 105648 TaxID=3032206 RepID=UPI0024A1DF25|nr:SDR family oxidoreductase [Actinokineospora sp. NBRC 105648]GLZ39875.1 short chain dehydrogenase [Actinokineospora sp. NBRC 105648]
MATYLVTGATGLIGGRLVRELLARADAERVWLLVRAQSRERLTRATSALPGAERVRPVVGDVSAPGLGIAADQLPELAGVDHVIHLAALYDVTAGDEASVAANVDGTRHVLELAAELGAGCLHHVSSVAVAGDYRGRFTEEMFDAGQRLATAYHRTKFESERLVRGQSAVPWRVYRPAVVVGDSVTGEMDKVDGPYYFFSALSRLESVPGLPLLFPDIGDTNIVPVDYVARAMAHLVHQPGLDGRTFHLVSPEPQSAKQVYNAFARAAGAPPAAAELDRRISAPLLGLLRFAENVPGVSLAVDAALDRLGIPPVLLTTLTFKPTFDSAGTQRALAGSGIEVPDLDDYAGVLWRYWREHLDPLRARRHGHRGTLDGRRVVITGASSGIGRATALKVAAAGGVPLLLARRESELEEVRAEIVAAGGEAYAYPCDLTDDESVAKTVSAMLADQPAVDMLVNNAGRSIRRAARLSYDRMHDYERAMAINYFGAVRLILALLPHLTERHFGHIVNVSSIGVQGIAPRFSAYVASKAALDYFSKIVATETHGAGITFTTVHMPLVRTPMITPTKIYDAFPAKSPEQAADMVLKALVERPAHIGTPTGYAIQAAYAVSPALVNAIAYQAYRIFPDSTAPGTPQSPLRLGKGERNLTAAARALAKLTRGFHW